jgi:acyl-CoA dehydrogenase
MEELARVCPSTAVTLSVTNSVCLWPIYKYGTPAQHDKFLRPLASGGGIGGFALTEPGSGSDAGAMRARAVRKGDKYILNGTKAWITNAFHGKVFLAFALTDPEKGTKGITAFLLTPDMPGFRFGPPEDKMGLKASATSMIFLEDCECPAQNRLGEEGQGYRIALSTLDGSRVSIAAQSVGVARGAYEEALKYAKERQTFGKPLTDHQAIQFYLADMATQIEAARLLTWKAAAQIDAGVERLGKQSAYAKYYASEVANQVAYLAVQVHGAYGYSREYAVERFYRDARVLTIYEGTSEIQKMVIGRELVA